MRCMGDSSLDRGSLHRSIVNVHACNGYACMHVCMCLCFARLASCKGFSEFSHRLGGYYAKLHYIYICMYVCMYVRYVCMYVIMYVCMYVCWYARMLHACLQCMDAWLVGWLDGWMDGCMDGWIYVLCIYVVMYLCMYVRMCISM